MNHTTCLDLHEAFGKFGKRYEDRSRNALLLVLVRHSDIDEYHALGQYAVEFFDRYL